MTQKKLTGAEVDVPVVQIKHVPLEIQDAFRIYAVANHLSLAQAFTEAMKALAQNNKLPK